MSHIEDLRNVFVIAKNRVISCGASLSMAQRAVQDAESALETARSQYSKAAEALAIASINESGAV